MGKDKIFELRIEEDDEISGVDQISLVDEPAIDVNWIAFNKQKSHEFHIPDGEDSKYVEMLMQKGEDEQSLFDQGYVIDAIEYMDGKSKFATNPNADSEWDDPEYLVRYKYMLRPNIKQAAIIPTTRQFCSNLIDKNYVWRVEEMDELTNGQGSSALVWRGGYNCRHIWGKIRYKKDATIINKASINKGKITDGVFPTDLGGEFDILGYTQADTVTEKTLNNPSPSTIKNLGLAKQQMEIVAPNVNVYGYHTRYFQMCPGAQATFEHLISMDNEEDTVGMIRSAAQVADNVFRIEYEVIKADAATQHQYEEAVVLVDDFKDIIHEIDEETEMIHDVSYMDGHIEKIASYLKQDMESTVIICKKCEHEWDMKDGGDKPYMCNKCGYDNTAEYEMGYDVSTIGGYKDPGIRRPKKKRDSFETYSDYPDSVKNNAKAVLKYVEENGWGSCGTDVGKQRVNQLSKGEPISEDTIKRMYSYLSRHAVDLESSKGYGDGCGKLMYDAWGGKTALSWAESKINAIERQKMSKQEFKTDDDKRIVIGPAMIPDLKIFRKDADGNPYYVYFSSDTIKTIAEKYMRNKYLDNNDEMHNGKAIQDVYVYESWIKEYDEDKSNKYGYADLPIGTWFVAMKVRNDNVWNKIKAGELKGFSVSGYFEEIAKFAKEEMFLQQVAKILKNIKD
jgi:hypothetical protein